MGLTSNNKEGIIIDTNFIVIHWHTINHMFYKSTTTFLLEKLENLIFLKNLVNISTRSFKKIKFQIDSHDDIVKMLQQKDQLQLQ